MSPRLQSFLVLVGVGFLYLLYQPASVSAPVVQIATTTPPSPATTSVQTALVNAAPTSTKPVKAKTSPKNLLSATMPAPNQVTRVENPYSTTSLSGEILNAMVRAALVNIVCMPHSGSLSPISGSGVVIDPRGIILTNAHVAQYVLLSQDPRVDLSCVVRTGAPAVAHYTPRVLYFPAVWAAAHASEIRVERPSGTGEHDFALLLTTGALNGASLPATFSYLSPDTREAVAFKGDQMLVASYPAEFVGGLATQSNLYPASSPASIEELLTFDVNSVDALSLGGIIEAQSGSSGGAVVNAWGRLVGLIVTMSEGTTTAERDLHALSLSYINRDLKTLTGSDIVYTLSGDPYLRAQFFSDTAAASITQLFVNTLKSH